MCQWMWVFRGTPLYRPTPGERGMPLSRLTGRSLHRLTFPVPLSSLSLLLLLQASPSAWADVPLIWAWRKRKWEHLGRRGGGGWEEEEWSQEEEEEEWLSWSRNRLVSTAVTQHIGTSAQCTATLPFSFTKQNSKHLFFLLKCWVTNISY